MQMSDSTPATTKAGFVALWIVAALYLALSLVFGFLWRATILKSPTLALIMSGPLALTIFFLYMASQRREWARISLVVMILINLSQLSLSGMQTLFNTVPALGFFRLAMALVPLVAVALLFTHESNNWFRAKQVRTGADAAG
jgi:hypothetical protein